MNKPSKSNVFRTIISPIIITLFIISCKEKTIQVANEKTIYVAFDYAGVRLFKKKDLNAKKIAVIPFGQKVVLIKKDKKKQKVGEIIGNWIYIKWKGKKGWVFNTLIYLQRHQFSDLTSPSEKPDKQRRILSIFKITESQYKRWFTNKK